MIRKLHDIMKAKLTLMEELSEPIDIDNGVKQGDTDAPTLFAITLRCAFVLHSKIVIKGSTSGSEHLENFLLFVGFVVSKTKTFFELIRELLYADDADLVAHSEEDMQSTMNSFSNAYSIFGLTISLKKTKVMYTPAPGTAYTDPTIKS